MRSLLERSYEESRETEGRGVEILAKEKLILIFFAIFILQLIVPNLFAADVTNDLINLTAPINFTFHYNNTVNQTVDQPIQCWLNESMFNKSVNLCAIIKSLDHGESYELENNACDLKFTCPKSDECIEYDNFTQKIRFRVEREDDGDIIITNLYDNNTHVIDPDTTPLIETEFLLSCPDIEDNRIFTPINLTQDEFGVYCLQPFAEAGKKLVDATTEMSSLQRKAIEQLGGCLTTVDALSRENGRLTEKETQHTECLDENTRLLRDNERISGLHEEIADVKSQRTVLAILSGVFGGLVFFYAIYKLVFTSLSDGRSAK